MFSSASPDLPFLLFDATTLADILEFTSQSHLLFGLSVGVEPVVRNDSAMAAAAFGGVGRFPRGRSKRMFSLLNVIERESQMKNRMH
jgi:hypothetical protein